MPARFKLWWNYSGNRGSPMAEEAENKQFLESLHQQQQQPPPFPHRADQPLIVFDGHPHPLVFLENLPDDDKVGLLMCGACDNPVCESPHRSSIFHCPTCSDFYLHLLCGPLPLSLKQEIHLETLVLKDSHIPDLVMDDEFYCDSCEEIREPRECVYYCGRCDYSAEIKCVMPEIISALTGKSGDVALKTIGRWNQSGQVAGQGLSAEEIEEHRVRVEGLENPPGMISLEDIEQSLTETENQMLSDVLDSKGTLLGGLSCETHHKYSIDLVANWDSLELSSTLREIWHDSSIHFVHVGDYLVPHKLISVFDDLHQKCGDVSAESSLSPKLKALFFLYLCGTVERMWEVRLLDATDQDISSWYLSLRAVHAAGFRIQFVVDALTRAIYANFEHVRLQLVDEVESEITCMEDDVQDTKAALKETEEKLKQFKEDLDCGRCSIAQECLKEVGPVLYKTGYEVIFGDENKDISHYDLGFLENFARVSDHRHSIPLIPQEGPAGKDWRCSICGVDFSDSDPIYKCSRDSDCNLMVDGHCSGAIKSMVEMGGHEHQLFFLDRSFRRHPTECGKCAEQISLDSLVYKCGDCEFIWHLECGPLPCEVKLHLNGYDMTLTYEDSFILGDDPQDCWCDICEGQRDPAKPVYRSSYPPFIATIKCVMPQIKLALEGSLGHVKLRNVGVALPSGRVISWAGEEDDVQPEITEEENKLMSSDSNDVQTEEIDGMTGSTSGEDDDDDVMATWTLEEMLESLSEHEKDLIRYAAAEEEWSKYREVEEKVEEDAGGVAAVVIDEYSDAAFRCLEEELDSKTGRYLSIIFEYWKGCTDYQELRSGIIMPTVLVRIHMQHAFSTFIADTFVGDAQQLSHRLKTLVCTCHGFAFDSMQSTQVFEITEDVLGMWRTIFNWVSHLTYYGDDIPYQHNLNNKMVRICFGLKVRKFEADLKEKLQQLPGQIDEKEAELQALKAQLERYKGIPLKDSAEWKLYQEEARISKWKKVGELIP